MAAARPDMRISHGKSIQAQVRAYGELFLDSSKSKSVKKSIIQLQAWIRTSFSPLVLCFFLSDRDDDQNQMFNDGNANGVAQQNALTDEEKAVQLRATLNDLLNTFVIPQVRKAIESCQDQSVLSQTLIRSLATVRKDWNAFLTTAKFMLISLEAESGKAGSNQVELIFKRAFQDTVFKEFRARLVSSLHSLVEQVRTDKSKLQQVATDAQELIKQFFDDLSATTAGAATTGVAPGGNNASSSEWAHSETKKLEDFHNAFVEPYKTKMADQYEEAAKQFEMNNDLPSLLAWIPQARKAELELVRSMFFQVYPADFDALCNNIMYEFDRKVAAVNAQRLIEHNQFGVQHILNTLPLENPTTVWEVKASAENEAESAAAAAATGAAPSTSSASSALASGTDTQTLINRLRDLYEVASTAQTASSMPDVLRTLPRTITRNSRANERRRDQANSAAVTDVKAFKLFKDAIANHGATAIKTVVDSLRTSQEFPAEKVYAKEICTKLGKMLTQKADIVKNCCANDSHVERAYQQAFKDYLNNPANKPTFKRKIRDKVDDHEHRYPDIVSQYVDTFLSSSESNLDDYADIAVELLSYIVDKDIFVEVYRQSIARRFLSKDFTDQVRDREDLVLSRLKKHLPANQVRKCGQGMMDDLTSSQVMNEEFAKSPLATQADGAVFKPRILGSMNWPQSKAQDGTPVWNQSLSDASAQFARWYITKHKTRQLRWQPERGTAVMVIEFPKAKKEVSMTIVQANLLIHLDQQSITDKYISQGGINATELSDITGFKLDDVNCILMSMIAIQPKHPQVVAINGPHAVDKKTDSTNDRFLLNKDYKSAMKKFSLPAVPSKKGSHDEDRPSDKEIEAWRGSVAEAAIVRIMKSGKAMQHEELIRKTIDHLSRSFTAQPVFLKKCIGNLLSKEYIERDPDDTTVYKYLA